jgi:hypothetical protein
MERLEDSFRGYYYWWVLHGVVLPVPKTRLLAVLTSKSDDFKRLQKHLAAGSVVADSFFARREALSVYSKERGDQPYTKLKEVSGIYWSQEKGYDRDKIILAGRGGLPKGLLLPGHDDEPRTLALMLKALEQEWENTSTSHETSRQLLFASGLLPRNVNVPEWLQFGLGSFFETPLQSPWRSIGAPSPYWLPRYRELSKEKKHWKSPYDALVKVVTDEYFRKIDPADLLAEAGKAAAAGPQDIFGMLQTQPGEKGNDIQKRARERTLRKGRAAAWALTYYLAEQKLDGLRRYFKELARMPRDIELDDHVLLECFARAFDCLGPDKKPSEAKLTALANSWDTYIKVKPLEAEVIHQKIREAYAKMSIAPPPNAGNNNPGGVPGLGGPGFPGPGPGVGPGPGPGRGDQRPGGGRGPGGGS